MSRSRLAHAAVLACALVVAGSGAGTLPIDDHEAFVVQTAQEMRERGDWVVPYFNGRPRLNKPPLSYWVVAGLADLAGSARVQPWQGRAPSVAGAVGLVALTMILAELLADRRTAIVAGFVAASSYGVFRYAHTARPDMLYAFWCTTVITAFVWAARSPAPGRAPALVLWACVGLATLTKGPQLPIILLAACLLSALGSRWPMRRLVRTLRPVPGLALALALTVPWWWAVDRALPGGLAGTQLGGSLLRPTWSHLLDPYFLYRPLALLIPSVAVLVPAFLWRRWPRWNEAMRLLVLLVLVPAIVLSFGPQHRPHYMLPTLAPLAILLALVIVALPRSRGGRWTMRALALVWAVMIAIETSLAGTTLLWSRERFVVASLASYAGEALPADVPLVALDRDAPAATYYAGRRVRSVRKPRRLVTLLDATPGGTLGLLAPADRLAALPATLDVTVLRRWPDGAPDDVVLARVARASGGTVPTE